MEICTCIGLAESHAKATRFGEQMFCDVCGLERRNSTKIDVSSEDSTSTASQISQKSVPSRPTVAVTNHAARATRAAKTVEIYVSITSWIVYAVCAVMGVVGLATQQALPLLVAVFLVVIQVVSSASFRMITAYIMFRTDPQTEANR